MLSGGVGAKIFISHSSDTKADEQRVLALYEALKEAGHEPLLDRERLVPGEQWYQQLIDWGRKCQAAVVLLNGAALASKYVLFEAFMFRMRKESDSRFQIFPFLLDGVTAPQVAASLGAAQFTDFHLDSDVAGMCQRVCGDIRPRPNLTWDPSANLVRYLATLVSSMQLDQLEWALSLLGRPDPPEWAPEELALDTHKREFAHQLVDHGVRRAVDIHNAVTPYLEGEKLRNLFDTLAAAWAEPVVTELIRRESGKAPGDTTRKSIVMNGRFVASFTLHAFVRRALWPKKMFSIIPVPPPEGLRELKSIKAEIEERLPDWIEHLDDSLPQPYPIFVVLPAPGPKPADLATLRRDYPRLNFIVVSGEEAPAIVASQYADAIAIEPSVDTADEKKCAIQYEAAITFPGGNR